MSEQETSWKDELPEGFADAPFFKASETPEDVLSSIKNAAAYMGQSIRIPGEDASDEARKEFHTKVLEKAPALMFKPNEDDMDPFYASIGRPENPDGYQYEAPEGKEVPEDFNNFAAVAHKHGLSQTQFKGILGDILQAQWDANEVAEHDHGESLKGLATEWGAKHDINMSQVGNFLRLTNAPSGIVELFSEKAMSVDEIKWLHSIANGTKSATELADMQDPSNDELTPEEAQVKIQEMLNNKQHAYWNATDPTHKAAVQKMIDLQRMALGQKKTA